MADGKWIEGLTPSTPASEAARVILTTRLGVVRVTLPAAVERAAEDVEHVHQLRVGTRRAGAALNLLGDTIAGKWRSQTKKSLRSLRRAAGEARDWDVFILGLSEARPLSLATGKPAHDFLLGHALNERARAQDALVAAAADQGPEFTDLCDELSAAIEEGDTTRTFGEVAENEIGELFAAFNEAVDANPSEPVELHLLRIHAKRVRYAMELFVGCFAPAFRNVLYPEVEKLQEVLGTMQDAHVGLGRLELLRDRVERMLPKEWVRLKPGIMGQIASLKRKLPVCRKQFNAWRTSWAKLSSEHSLELAPA